jgi:hypothetical protein
MQTQNEVSANILTVNLGQFSGMLAKIQTSAYGDLVRAGIEKPIAHKVAFDYASDLGNAMKADGKFASQVGKAREGRSTLKLTAAAKSVTVSRTMSIIRAAQQTADLFDEGLFKTRQMPTLSDNLAEYLADCQEWTQGKSFVEDGKVVYDYTSEEKPEAPADSRE